MIARGPVVWLTIALAACGGGRGDHAEPGGPEHADHADHADHDRAGAGAGPTAGAHADDDGATLRVADDMIRDLRLTTAKAEARTAGERVSALGELQVDQDGYAEVSAPTAARVAKVLARAGDVVTRGQPLVVLASADLGRVRAEAQAATARVALARQALERKRALATDRLIAERDVVDAEAALAEAEADRSIAAASLAQLGGGGGLVLRAPIAGTIIDRDVALGQLADPTRTLYRIADLSSLWLVAHVFERDAVRVVIGGAGTASFAALPGRAVEGTVTWIGSEVDAASRTIPVRLAVANPDRVLRPGMSATVALALGEPGARVVAVPVAAVQRVDDAWVVFRPVGPGAFTIHPIGRGRELGGEVEVLGGLSAGDEVVVDGAFLLKAEADKAHGAGGHDHH